MDKAISREELVNAARKLYKGGWWQGEQLDAILEEQYPELKESDDERIRKALIDFFQKKVEKGFEWIEYGIPNNAVLAYLEKQKGPKPKFKVGDTIRHKKYPTESYKITSMYKDIIYISGETEETSIRIPVADQDLWELVEKPTEWGEEDKEMLELLHTCVCRCINDDRFDYAEREQISRRLIPFIERLKSLPERFNLQPRQEWSEEDEEHLDSIIESYKDLLKDYKACHDIDYIPYNSNTVIRNVVDDVNFLKSLRPQPHWKPSEEQMEALKGELKNKDYYIPYRRGLMSLYEDLKKL